MRRRHRPRSALLDKMAKAARPHKNDTMWGAVAEALVAAYALISANGKLTSYRPFSDIDGKDIIMDLAGGFNDIYLQVKCALALSQYHRIAGTVRLHRDHIPSDPKLIYIFTLLDPGKMELARIWVVPSAMFYKRAYRTELAKGMVQFNFDCHNDGDEKWDEFEVSRQELGPRLVSLIKSSRERPGHNRHVERLIGRWLQLAA
jgi:hypothetical protein